jgi:glycosyltransferase involved in cell wall biosynthesis
MTDSVNNLSIGFIMSTEVGLRTQFINWKSGLTPDLGINPEWIVIDWARNHSIVGRIPLLPIELKARTLAEMQLRTGLRKGPFDALFVAQERMFHGTNGFLFKQDFFITADVTAKQLEAFGSLYNMGPRGPVVYEQHKHRERRERFRHARALFPWSRWAADSMVNDYGANPDTIHIIPPGVDPEQWNMKIHRSRMERRGPVNILFVGGDFYRKGGDLLLDWAQRTNRKDWQLHLVTRDLVVPPHPSVRVYTRFGPNDPGLRDLYASADIFVLPSRGDCYSLAAIEAMAATLPVILTRTGGTSDIIQDGKTGYLIDVEDGRALGERLEHLLDNPAVRSSLACAARADAEQRYDSRTNIRRTVGLMRDMIGK